MIGINKINIEDIPTLIVAKIEHENKALPILVYYHGFRSGKENNLTIAYLLAEQGYRVILPECKYHGERFNDVTYEERELAFWDIVIKSIKELDTIKSYLHNNNLILNDRIGVAGTSMGGMITAGALTAYPWIKSAGLLMSSGKLKSFANLLIDFYNDNNERHIGEHDRETIIAEINQYDLYENIDKLNNRPLFIWHGKDDVVVPFTHAEQLFTTLKDQNKNQVQFVEEENRGHHLSRLAIKESIQFFATHI